MDTDPAEEFREQRERLFGLAYRMLGSATEAEDAVQDAYLRWSTADHAVLDSPAAWLTTVVTNLCRDRLTSARARREQYVGPWLPEPVLTGDGTLGPLDTTERRESVSFALLRLLERLSANERAVFVLREAFGYSHREIAETAGLSESNSRQLHRRARERVGADTTPHRTVDHGVWQELVERFLTAASEGDVEGLHRVLTENAVSVADGGGEVAAARHPIVGRDKVARYLVGLLRRFADGIDVTFDEVNGHPAVLGHADGELAGMFVPDFTADRLRTVHIVASPSKLRYAARQLAARPATRASSRAR